MKEPVKQSNSQTEKTETTVSRKAGQGSTFLPRSLFKNRASLCWQRNFFPSAMSLFSRRSSFVSPPLGLVLGRRKRWMAVFSEFVPEGSSLPWYNLKESLCVSVYNTDLIYDMNEPRNNCKSPLLMHVWVDGKPTSQKFSGVEGGIYRNLCLEHADNFFSFSSSGRWA